MDAAIVWLAWLTTYGNDSLAVVIALLSLIVSVGTFTRTNRERAARRLAHSRAAVAVAKELLPHLVEFVRHPNPTEAKAALNTRGMWRELDRFATMADRKTRRVGQRAVDALNAWEEAWREYNYNPHTDDRHATAKQAAGAARDLIATLATR